MNLEIYRRTTLTNHTKEAKEETKKLLVFDKGRKSK